MAPSSNACLLFAALLALVCAQGAPTPATVADFVAGDADYSVLLAAVQDANLTDALGKDFKGTVFAPNNAAFAEFEALLQSFGRNETVETTPAEVLAMLLSDHVSADAVSEPFTEGQVISTLRGKILTVAIEHDVTTLVGNGVATSISGGSFKTENGATIVPISSVLQYVNRAAADSYTRRRLLSCSCDGVADCCGSGCACCTGCTGLYCNC